MGLWNNLWVISVWLLVYTEFLMGVRVSLARLFAGAGRVRYAWRPAATRA
jgi:hypothetical protein